MVKQIIEGGHPLIGEVQISGAKNSVLPILCACLLSNDPVIIENVPHLDDVTTTMTLLGQMGAELTLHENQTIEVNASKVNNLFASYDLVSLMRASILVLGPLLAKHGQAQVSLPGGCAIGPRPIDIHIDGLQKMGANINVENGYIIAESPTGLHGIEFNFPTVTVTGTENLLMAATLAKGTTVLTNCAKEPEVKDLGELLISMGAKIEGLGTDTITIHGIEKLHGTKYRVLPDRVETGTFLVAAAGTQGKIKLKGADYKTMEVVLDKLREMGASITTGPDWIELDMQGRVLKVCDISTAPYPGFPTDMQAQFMALNTIAEGVATITENVFENRFMHAPELQRMGANIEIHGNQATIKGEKTLTGAPVRATDLRAAASLVIAGLLAKGTTEIENIHHLDRGYERIEEKLSGLGAKITRNPYRMSA